MRSPKPIESTDDLNEVLIRLEQNVIKNLIGKQFEMPRDLLHTVSTLAYESLMNAQVRIGDILQVLPTEVSKGDSKVAGRCVAVRVLRDEAEPRDAVIRISALRDLPDQDGASYREIIDTLGDDVDALHKAYFENLTAKTAAVMEGIRGKIENGLAA